MENIESTIVELGSIFQELAHMVKEQEEQIERFGDNAYRSLVYVHNFWQGLTWFLTTMVKRRPKDICNDIWPIENKTTNNNAIKLTKLKLKAKTCYWSRSWCCARENRQPVPRV